MGVRQASRTNIYGKLMPMVKRGGVVESKPRKEVVSQGRNCMVKTRKLSVEFYIGKYWE